jgi:SAM-dependent methyltransferase
MKLNLGSGPRRIDGYLNVDIVEASAPDVVWDLEQTPWPWPDNSVTDVMLSHVLEHLGRDPAKFLDVMKELYRIMTPGGEVVIHVPHPRHDDFISDPTHVRAITPAGLKLFDREHNKAWQAAGKANTPLALYTGVDFYMKSLQIILAKDIYEDLQAGRLSRAEVDLMVQRQNNVARSYHMVLVARKDGA